MCWLKLFDKGFINLWLCCVILYWIFVLVFKVDIIGVSLKCVFFLGKINLNGIDVLSLRWFFICDG